jgi:glyceraldehyde 3-phosphate dehydrogenase
MTINVGINGMGRIGRMVIRAIIESQNKNVQIKHINNRSNSEASCTLIKYDSVHGKFNADLDYDENHLIINKIKLLFLKSPKLRILIGKNLVLITFLNVLESLIRKKNY